MGQLHINVERCPCGTKPALHQRQYSEDGVETWVECPACGREGPRTDDAYADPWTAASAWNVAIHTPTE